MYWSPYSLVINVTEKRTKASQHLNKSFEWRRSIAEDYLEKLQESLSKRVQAVLKNKGGQICFVYCISMYRLTKSLHPFSILI